jgi:hypothetical protein
MIDSLTYIDDKDNYFVTYHQKNEYSNILSEVFILIPLKESSKDSRTLVIFMTNFDIGLNLPYSVRQMIKEERLNILSNFKQFIEYNEFNLTNLNELVVKLPAIRKSSFLQEEDLININTDKVYLEDYKHEEFVIHTLM